MSDCGTSVTLIFYKIGSDWWKEPALNLIAAAAQLSSYTHVEISIGEVPGTGGQMANVARVFNDAIGVYTYLSLGCSKAAEARMLAFARAQVGKPFSNMAMARSLVWPRSTDNSTFYCAELVAAILQQGGLLSGDSNPGAATPYSLYKLYKKQAAVTANPYTLRQVKGGLQMSSVIGHRVASTPAIPFSESSTAAQMQVLLSSGVSLHPSGNGSARRRDGSPPRASFKVISSSRTSCTNTERAGLTLSLTSLRR